MVNNPLEHLLLIAFRRTFGNGNRKCVCIIISIGGAEIHLDPSFITSLLFMQSILVLITIFHVSKFITSKIISFHRFSKWCIRVRDCVIVLVSIRAYIVSYAYLKLHLWDFTREFSWYIDFIESEILVKSSKRLARL